MNTEGQENSREGAQAAPSDVQQATPAPAAAPQKPKRRRGRPSNAERAAAAGKPAETPIPGTSSTQTSAPKKKAPSSDQTVANLAAQLEGMHQLAAMMFGLPELQLDSREAAMLAKGIEGVAREYGWELKGGKMVATLQLLGVSAMVYVPRFRALEARARAAKAAAQAQTFAQAPEAAQAQQPTPEQANAMGQIIAAGAMQPQAPGMGGM